LYWSVFVASKSSNDFRELKGGSIETDQQMTGLAIYAADQGGRRVSAGLEKQGAKAAWRVSRW
jgi:hypothetical protein